jgi:hypothetical protein
MISITIQCMATTSVIQVPTGPGKHIIVKSAEYDLKSTWGIVFEK